MLPNASVMTCNNKKRNTVLPSNKNAFFLKFITINVKKDVSDYFLRKVCESYWQFTDCFCMQCM